MYKDELRYCEIGRYSLSETHNYLLENENVRGVHLQHIRGLSSKQLGLADVSNIDPAGCRRRKTNLSTLRQDWKVPFWTKVQVRAPQVACRHAEEVKGHLPKFRRRKMQVWQQLHVSTCRESQAKL